MRQAIADAVPPRALTLVLLVGVLALMAMRIVDADVGLAFLGGRLMVGGAYSK